jgi:adenylate kinase
MSSYLEEVGDHVKSSWPLWTGLHACYNEDYKKKQVCEHEQIYKNSLSTDWSLQFGIIKKKSLVIVDQHATVNIFRALHTLPVTRRKLIKLQA